jgi:hypothetical protein
MKNIKLYYKEDNRQVGIYLNESTGVFAAMTFTKSKEFKTLKGAEKWISKYL